MNLPALSATCSLPLTHRHLKELALSKQVIFERARGRDQNKNLKGFWLQMFRWFYVEFRKRVLFSVQPMSRRSCHLIPHSYVLSGFST